MTQQKVVLRALALLGGALALGGCLTGTLGARDGAADAVTTADGVVVRDGDAPDAPLESDAGAPDSTGLESGIRDSEAADAPAVDASEPDVVTDDAALVDTAVSDAPAADAVLLDVARLDAGTLDGAPRDVAVLDAVTVDTAVGRDGSVSVRDVLTVDAPADVRPPDASGCAPVARDRATWVVSAEPAVDATMRDALFAMLSARGVTRVYIDVGRLLDSTSGRSSLAAYLRALNARCIATELLFGNRYRVDMPDGVLERARAAVAYVRGVPASDAPAALHFDLEPHVYPGFGSTSAAFNATAEQYISVLEQLGPIVRGAGLALHIDMAHWYWTRSYTRAGRTATLDVWATERVDGFAIMNYWGASAFDATQSRLVTQSREVQTAQMLGKRAWVGLQVNCGGPVDETLCEEGTAVTERHIMGLNTALGSMRAYAGVAFYDHEGLGALRP